MTLAGERVKTPSLYSKQKNSVSKAKRSFSDRNLPKVHSDFSHYYSTIYNGIYSSIIGLKQDPNCSHLHPHKNDLCQFQELGQ